MACIEVIRHLYFRQGWKVRRIARELRVSRETVRKAIRSSEVPTYHLTASRPKPVLGPYLEHIDRPLSEREEQPRKQQYTAHRILELLRDEYGYPGYQSIVRAYVTEKKLEVRDVFLPREFEAGKHAQRDWQTVVVVLGGKRVSVEWFALRLCFSAVGAGAI